MKSRHNSAAARVCALAILLPALALADGELASVLRGTIESIRDGHPNLSTMEPMTADAVQQQESQFKPILQRMGAVRSLKYMGMQTMVGGSGEAYKVTFEHGAMLWVISESSAGKIQILWTSGPQYPQGNDGQ